MENRNFSDKIEAYFSELGRRGVGAALVGGAWRGQRLGVVHVSGATLGLMAVVCVVWADVEGAPTDGKNQLVGDMLCLAGSLVYALVTILQEMMLTKQSCSEYLALLGFIGGFHALYFLSYLLAMVGVFLFCSRSTKPPPSPEALPQIVNDAVRSQDNLSLEYTVPTLDCIPIEGLEPPMSRDTTFTSFLGAPQTSVPNGNLLMGQTHDNQSPSKDL
ncbi:hypothetical protein RR46_11544 [Papilio xuthus]|uniref:Uncharacterized protein n=1 Tax=Papilio xuthus TaxID=66420 RepID=A0A194PQV5_PAPXU|nr:hypothetical protein RR46_11544 [Papilio xuthus]